MNLFGESSLTKAINRLAEAIEEFNGNQAGLEAHQQPGEESGSTETEPPMSKAKGKITKRDAKRS